MKNSGRLGLLLTMLASITACAPVVSTVSLGTSPADAAECTVATLRSLGYGVLDESPDAIRAERDKHVRNPVTGAGDFDRITAVVTDTKLRVVGETMRTGSPGLQRRQGLEQRLDSTQAFRSAPSRQVRADVESVAASCGGSGETR